MCKIVVVDDERRVRDGLKSILSTLFPEHMVYSFASTSSALEKVKDLNFVDIIIFNSLKDKKPDGIDFAKTVRKKLPGAMLIYITHSTVPNYDQMCKLAGFGIDNYLLEPYTPKAIKFLITNSLNRIKSLQSYKAEEHSQLEDAVDRFFDTFNEFLDKNLGEKKSKSIIKKFSLKRAKNNGRNTK